MNVRPASSGLWPADTLPAQSGAASYGHEQRKAWAGPRGVRRIGWRSAAVFADARGRGCSNSDQGCWLSRKR